MLVLPIVLAAGPLLSDQILSYVYERYGSAARQRVQDWETLMRAHRNEPERDKLERVNRFFNRVRYRSDRDHWGKRDYWATPVELLSTNAGDCEDYSIAKYFTLKEMGVPVERMRITYVKALKLKQAHMVLAYYPTPSADPLILDNLSRRIKPGTKRRDLKPVYSFNGDGLWMAVERGRGRRVGGSDGISLWSGLLARMEEEKDRAFALPAAPAPEPQTEDYAVGDWLEETGGG